MCGYINDAAQKTISEEDILYQFNEVMHHFSGEKIVKIFTSGSFFDEKEIPNTAQDKILKNLGAKVKKIIVETRPEFVKEERKSSLISFPIDLKSF